MKASPYWTKGGQDVHRQIHDQEVIAIDPETTIAEAAELLARHRIRHLPVADKDGILVGIVTDRDVRSAMPSSVATGEEAVRERERVKQRTVKDIMTRKVVTVSPMNTLEDALLLMQQTKVGAFRSLMPREN